MLTTGNLQHRPIGTDSPETCLTTIRRLMEATEIAQDSPAVNRDGGWRLLV